MVEFIKVSFKNFGSFGNAQSTIDLNRKKSVLVTGPNGHGKSFAFLDAITFGLFGKAFRPINIPQLVNSINKKQCLVEVEFKKGKNTFVVRRGLNPKLFEIFKDGVLIDQNAKSKDYQEYFEEHILGFNFHAFKQVVVLGKASFTPFMQLVPADRRKIVENLLGLGVLSEMANIAKTKIAEEKTQIAATEEEIKIWQERLSSRENALQRAQEDQEKNLNEKEEIVRALYAQIAELNDTKSSLHKTISEHKVVLQKLKEKHAKRLEMRNHFNSLQNEHLEIIDQIKRISNNEACVCCGQKMTEDSLQFALNTKIQKREEYERIIEKAKILLSNIDGELSTYEKENQTSEKLQRESSNLHVEICKHEAILARELSEFERIKNARGKGTELLLANDVDSAQAMMIVLRERLDKAKESLCYYEALLEMLKDTGLKSKIIKQYIPVINKYMNEFLTKFNLYVEFHLDENFSETIKSRYRDEFSYGCFSEGEKQRIDLAILLTWRKVAMMKNSLNCNLLIFDDILDGPLETSGVDAFMKIINKMKSKNTIFNVSHKSDQLVDKFDEHISVVKKNNFSKLVFAV